MIYNYANSKPFSQVNKPFQFDQTFSIHGDNWNLRCVWFHGKSGFESKVWVLDLAIKREIQNGFHPHPPRNLSPNHDFMGVLQALCVTTHKGSWVKLLLCLISIVTRSSSHLVREMNQTQGSKHCCLFRKTLRKRAIWEFSRSHSGLRCLLLAS